ncbi:MAG: HAD hydrolase-like protein [Lachnospiraceae bacterium]|nr:HAD hydrolase-like protein [Lachnospiraceae bacterium]
MMKYRYIFFDLDGTLTQSEFGIIASAKYALSKFGIIEEDRAKLLKFIGPPLYYSFEKFYGITGPRADEAIKYYREYYEADAYKDAPVFGGVEDVLSRLKADGCKLVVVTAKPQYLAERVIEYTGLDRFFDHIVGPGAEMKNPSKADLIRCAIDKTGADPVKTIMVGDRHYDIEGACEVGVDSIGAVYGYGTADELRKAGATYLAETAEQIGDFV